MLGYMANSHAIFRTLGSEYFQDFEEANSAPVRDLSFSAPNQSQAANIQTVDRLSMPGAIQARGLGSSWGPQHRNIR